MLATGACRAGAAARAWLVAAAAMALAMPASAFGVRVNPQGEAAVVRQVTVAFDAAVSALGDAAQPDPVVLECRGAAVKGSGRWLDDRRWVYDFDEALPPGVSCRVSRREAWRPAAGEWSGPQSFAFDTGGPAVVRMFPWQGSEVEEDARFVLQFNGEVSGDEVARLAGCEIEGLAERVPVRLVTGAVRDAVLALRRLQPQAARSVVLHCERPLPPGARVQIVIDAGLASARSAAPRTRSAQQLAWRVRPAFTAEFSCERERAAAPCLPIRPMTVRFSAPVPRAAALAARLVPAAGGAAVAARAADDSADELTEVRFAAPFAERAAYRVELPRDLADSGGRALANAASFPVAVRTGEAPPIAKFAAAPFGIVEWTGEALLPVTMRQVQAELRAPGAPVRVRTVAGDADIVAWIRRLEKYHESRISAREAGLPREQWTEWVQERDDSGRVQRRRVDRMVGTRELSLLAGDAQARRLELPAAGADGQPSFEVLGIPLPGPGYHVVEIESRRLGQALLDKAAPMYVRTGVLATNLAVHFKQGRDNAAVWVTTLDRARPVADAAVAIADCAGRALWSGRTGADGVARVPVGVQPEERCDGAPAVFVSARKADARGVEDLAFVFENWTRGIEPWRFGVATRRDPEPDLRVHTVFDRTLLRVGETVSMKHFARREVARGLARPDDAELPARARLVHTGSGDEVVLPLAWSARRSALSSWTIPAGARLGSWRVELDNPDAPEARRRSVTSGEFRVEAFRLPLVDARLAPPRGDPVAPAEVVFAAQINWMAGGPIAGTALTGTAMLRPREATMPGWGEFQFGPPRVLRGGAEADAEARGDGRLVVDKRRLTTAADGSARLVVGPLPAIEQPSELLAELSFADPNGEVQTVSSRVALWPSAVVLGVRASPVDADGRSRVSVLALDTQGRPLPRQAVELRGRQIRVVSTRKRIVGGFYAYDNRQEARDLGLLCDGRTDERGLLVCTATLAEGGEVELVASARDAAGHAARAAAGVWVPRRGEAWFEQDNDDRIDVLPDKRRYEPGQTARLQVRMPFRDATAWVAVEREGVLDTRVVRLRGTDPTIELPVDAAWGPNVYVSVLVVRGRVRQVPWTSFFSWGWKEPIEWIRAYWNEGPDWKPPTAMVDLARPAFKLGVASLRVGLAPHELQVAVQPDRARYAPRGKAQVRVRVSHGGQPAAGAEVAFAAVDESLLALRDNDSWQLLGAMLAERPWGVQTATAQGELIGRRHFGRKAVPAGGGGGKAPTRELFDTLLLWQPRVALDARGEALIEVPVNDSLTSFRLVAVADDGDARFGTGSAVIQVSQDLQMLSGMPPLVREGDRFSAGFTLRNTTGREMRVRATLSGQPRGAGAPASAALAPITAPAQEVMVPAGAARELQWPLEVPAGATAIAWTAQADEAGGARDRVAWVQTVAAAVPVQVVQATLAQVDGRASWPIAPPAGALPGRGGVALEFSPSLGGSLPGVRRFFESYPYSCLEQKASRAIGLADAAAWTALMQALPGYLDGDGLAGYFPPRAEDPPRGSDRLTAYLVSAAHEAGFELPAAARERMLGALAAFVEGRIERRSWAPRADLDVRKLAALEALSRHGRVQPRMLGSIALAPAQWPTAAVIDWLLVLRRVETIPERARRIDEAAQLLRSRITWSGTTLRFSTEGDDFWWWLMDSPDVNASRLVLALLDDPAWREQMPQLAAGTLGRQQRGAWLTTTANVWGVLALRRFAARFESAPVAGHTRADAGGAAGAVDWSRTPQGGRVELPWPPAPSTLAVVHEGSGRPWLTVHSLAAVPAAAPVRAGFAVTRTVTAVEQKVAGRWSRGDVLRVRLEVDAAADMSWVVVADPVPAGATLLGSGLGRDSAIARSGERAPGGAWPAFEERGFDAMRQYFEFMPRGRHTVEYTMRLNAAGRFGLPATRVEAMYAPDSHATAPNAAIEVAP